MSNPNTTSIIPMIGLGTWKLNGAECEKTVQQALELGYRHIDTADAYKNHQEIGIAIQAWPREQLFLTTKLAIDGLEASQVKESVSRFLHELKVDYIDLLLIHWPNPNVELAETLKAMLAVKESGWIRYIGVSNFVRSHLEALAPYHFPILTNQIELHPYLQRRLLTKMCKSMGIKVTAYRPLAKGAFENEPILQKIGKKHGKTPSQVTLRWIVQQDFAAIPKASSYQHLKDNLNIFDFDLSADDMEAINALDSGKRYCAPDGYPLFDD